MDRWQIKLLIRMVSLQACVVLVWMCVAGYISDYSMAVGNSSNSMAIHFGEGTFGVGCNTNSNVANIRQRAGNCFEVDDAYGQAINGTSQSDALRRELKAARGLGWQFQSGEGWAGSFCCDSSGLSGQGLGISWRYSNMEGVIRWHYHEINMPAWWFGAIAALLLLLAVPKLALAVWLLVYRFVFFQSYLMQQRSKRGLCRMCGYDLRATPDRCPECGSIPTPVKPAMLSPG